MFLLRKNVTLPHLAVLHAKFRGSLISLMLFLFHDFFANYFANFEITTNVMQVDKICFTNFVDFACSAHFPGLILQLSVASTTLSYEHLLLGVCNPLASS
jgi:hypothetical protein